MNEFIVTWVIKRQNEVHLSKKMNRPAKFSECASISGFGSVMSTNVLVYNSTFDISVVMPCRFFSFPFIENTYIFK